MISSILLRAFFPATVLATVVGAATAFSPSTSSATAASPVSSYARAAHDGSAPSRRLGGARSDSSGVYTAAQAERGKAVYTAVCAECHELEDFTHEDFRFEWNGVSLYEFFETIRTTMPDENPGTLERAQDVDVVTYVLKLNELPEGPEEFTADSVRASEVILSLPKRGQPADTLR